jgi:hypothetical protein
MSEDLLQKIIDIVCKEWPTLEMDTCSGLRNLRAPQKAGHQRQRPRPERRAARALASRGRITLTLVPHGDTPGWARAGGGATIHDVEDDLCE